MVDNAAFPEFHVVDMDLGRARDLTPQMLAEAFDQIERWSQEEELWVRFVFFTTRRRHLVSAFVQVVAAVLVERSKVTG